MQLNNEGTTLMFAIDDKDAGHNIPSLPIGNTGEGKAIMAKAVFADRESAVLMVEHLNTMPGTHPERFEVQVVEVWRPTDIELHVRERIRQHEKEKGPKLILPGGLS